MNDNAFGIRDGEIAIELPAKFDASLYFIGRIRTPWRRREDCPKNARESDAVCTLEVDERWAQALTGVETCSHLVVLYWMSRSRRDLVLQVPRHYGVGRGTFALRSPARPNPIAMSVVRLSRVEGTKLSVVGLDCLDETPPPRHQALFRFDRCGCRRRGWLARRPGVTGRPAPVSRRLRDSSSGVAKLPHFLHCEKQRKPGDISEITSFRREPVTKL